MKILFSNIGYARGIDGSLQHHLIRAGTHLYTPLKQQKEVLTQFRDLVDKHQPDICCLVEVDRGSPHSGFFNQIQSLVCDTYCHYDIADKYGKQRPTRFLPFHWGKSNGFIANMPLTSRKHYFPCGTKRLVYELLIPNHITLFFAHFSLKKMVRKEQFAFMRALAEKAMGDVVILGDFNIHHGVDELQSLVHGNFLQLLNQPGETTFTFHRKKMMLDICLCSPEIAKRSTLKVLPQPYSDHAALLLDVSTSSQV